MARSGNQQKKRFKTGQGKYAQWEYLIIKVARDEEIRKQIGKIRNFDLVDHAKVTGFQVPKHACINMFKELVAEACGIPVQFQRFWLWARRNNGAYRPDRPLTSLEEDEPVGEIQARLEMGDDEELDLFLEVGSHNSTDLGFAPLPSKMIGDILLFIKLYKPETDELSYVGRLVVKSSSKPAEVVAKLNEMVGYSLDEKIDLYEEVLFEPELMIEPIDKECSFDSSELIDGDIICFQKSPSPETFLQCRHPTIPSFYTCIHNHGQELKRTFKDDDLAIKFVELKTELNESRSEAIDLRNQNLKLEKELKQLRAKLKM